ncbi:hypothetical protein TTHERM_00136370 (macronuclear) [Tetrahymena thermophila SB210]|uniref:U6 snRNA phosphodiesterase 1 n=1 Tax=Tetrahymena thermophila (strain SB210) TaxID=312017 RepID=I7LVP6_TETTS|nr:hypothetical protein TTHERM_00136370 [Tetrahymena thermophila SB210]EAR99473.2 hypothetical protein TTHERM_00136370 [Tetrahymena thermophila SB210]|eukprot:XP_001019718.2 hypothetical protein TTHERM_00136370 [Tetrahymena thermophila SB210]
MNIVNYSDESGSENESKLTKNNKQVTEAKEKEIKVIETQKPQQAPKKKKLLGLNEILNQDYQDKGIEDGKFIPHKKLKLNEEENEQDNKEEQKQMGIQTVLKKSQQYEIQDLQKTRKVPHIDGQFACYIYIDVNVGLAQLVKAQSNFKNRVNRDYPDYQFVDIEPDNFHISLSKTFYLNRHQIEPFMSSLREKYLKSFQQISLSIDLNKLKVFSNEDRNRFFVAASVGQGKNIVKDIVNQIDNCLQAYGLDTFFKGNKHHVSLLWTNNKATQNAEFKLYVKDNRFNSSGTDGQVIFDVSEVQCKIGKRINTIKLNPV